MSVHTDPALQAIIDQNPGLDVYLRVQWGSRPGHEFTLEEGEHRLVRVQVYPRGTMQRLVARPAMSPAGGLVAECSLLIPTGFTFPVRTVMSFLNRAQAQAGDLAPPFFNYLRLLIGTRKTRRPLESLVFCWRLNWDGSPRGKPELVFESTHGFPEIRQALDGPTTRNEAAAIIDRMLAVDKQILKDRPGRRQ